MYLLIYSCSQHVPDLIYFTSDIPKLLLLFIFCIICIIAHSMARGFPYEPLGIPPAELLKILGAYSDIKQAWFCLPKVKREKIIRNFNQLLLINFLVLFVSSIFWAHARMTQSCPLGICFSQWQQRRSDASFKIQCGHLAHPFLPLQRQKQASRSNLHQSESSQWTCRVSER